MDNRLNNTSRVKSINVYLKDCIKFYDIQNPLVAQIIFVMNLAIIFGGYIFAMPYTEVFLKNFGQISAQLQSQIETKNIDLSLLNPDIYMNMVNSMFSVFLILFVINSLSFIVSSYYGSYYYFSLVRPSMRDSERMSVFLKRLPKIIIFNILFYCLFFFVVLVLMIVTGFAAMFVSFLAIFAVILPLFVMITNTVFIFKDLLIIEFDIGVFRNFKKSLDITKDCRKNVIINGLWPICTGWILSSFATDIQNQMLSIFITAFFEVIFLLIAQRLTSLMFIDAASLERHDKKPEKTNSEMPNV